MPVNVIWDDREQTIIRQIYIGNTTRADYQQAISDFIQLAADVDYTVHSIHDNQSTDQARDQLLSILREADARLPHQRIGVRALVNPTPMTYAVVAVARRITPRVVEDLHLVLTLAEARAIIAAERTDGVVSTFDDTDT